MISDIIDKVLVEVKTIDKLCAPSKDAADDLSFILKSLYDSSVQISQKKIGPLDKLVVAGLDDESIWEEIQTRNKPLLRYLTKIVTRLKKRVEAIMENSDDDEEEREEMEVVEEDDNVDDVEDDVELEDAPSGEENSGDEDEGVDSEDDEGDFDESKDDFVESGSEEGEGDDGDSEDDMEAWLDREDELEMDREEREERRARKADKKKVKITDQRTSTLSRKFF